MSSSIILAASLVLVILCQQSQVAQSAPVQGNYPYQVISSVDDLSGLPVRNRRIGDDDFYICYTSSEVYHYYKPSPNALEPYRRRAILSDDDYYICYPSSEVNAYYSSPNGLGPNRRSGEADRRYPVFDSYDARILRADRERANYKDSFGR